ncbi:hypothetical protein AUR04nite_03560 [Glutamicibacter uratoxydans]|uniref:Epimerase n=1 Tax=Glutamicibacter uratoxydans TaxID=43667 RepID=A0A4Y4DLX1_GLUUR|nr:DUF1304 domain-containing protein [Glutamicibacter uratoxydans]GED04824.1 hypothetical protein AUR04nite_03560 [Glutamicibacter uratoxydans]
MLVAAQILSLIAALIHVYIFLMESLWWERPQTRKVFGTSEQEAKSTSALAFNQGFYNLFLAIGALVGLAFFIASQPLIAATLLYTSLGSMAAAAAVLIISSPDKASAAVKQGAAPLLGLIALLLAQAL